MVDTFQIDGTELSSLSCITSYAGLYQSALPRGENITLPGRDGEVWVDKAFQTNVIDIGIILSRDSSSDFNAAMNSIKQLVKPGRKVTLTRTRTVGGVPETTSATAEFVAGLNFDMTRLQIGRTVLSFKLLDALWHSTTNTVINLSAANNQSVNVLGDVRTHRMTINAPAQSTIVNKTTGHTLIIAVPTTDFLNPSTPVVVDVDKVNVLQGSIDASVGMTFTNTYPMRLNPGTNIFDVTGGSVTITYKAAFL